MNNNQGIPTPPPYTVKTEQPLPTRYYEQIPYPNPTIQQGQSIPMGNPMVMTAGAYPITCNCPYCYQPIVTRAEKDSGLAVWVAAAVLCLFGCFCGCCLIPFCINDLKDTTHYCPNCNKIIAQDKKL